MSDNSASQVQLVAAIGVLVKRRGNTTDPAEKAAINAAIDELNGDLQDLDRAELLDAARIVSGASDALEKVVASAKLGPFDTFLSDIQGIIDRLQNAVGQM